MNDEKFSVKEADRKVFKSAFDDGLVDIFLSSMVLMWAVAPLLSVYMGDFWSSAIFLVVWSLVFLILFWIRRSWIVPRKGVVKYGVSRRRKLSAFTWIMLVLNVLFMLLGIFAFLSPGGSGYTRMLPFVVMLLICSSLAGYFLEVTRFYLYGLLMAGGFFVGEWLYQTYGFSHHGYPVVFGCLTVIIFLIGVYKLVTFMRENPLPNQEQLHWEANNG